MSLLAGLTLIVSLGWAAIPTLALLVAAAAVAG
jgi:hypothetical protein